MRLHRSAGVTLLVAMIAAGCGGDDAATVATDQAAPTVTTTLPAETVETRTDTLGVAPVVDAPDLPGLPTAEVKLLEGYPGWTELATPPAARFSRQADGAHPGTKRVWAGPTGAAGTTPFPQGSVVVKEGRTGGDITFIAVMEKVRRADAATGGWRYAEYKRAAAGSDFAKVSFPESGCASCHAQVKATDFVFTTK